MFRINYFSIDIIGSIIKRMLFILHLNLHVMKRFLLISLMTALLATARAQQPATDTIWAYTGFFTQQFNQTSFTNWAAGGQNSLSSTSIFNIQATYDNDPILWENRLEMAFGIIRSEDIPIRKNEDRIDFLSRLGRDVTERLAVSGQVNFRSQFARGYDYSGDDRVLISRFMAPAYLLVALGMDYRPAENFSIFFSPATGKFTFVLDDTLAARGAFGVDPGENVRSEFGALLTLLFSMPIMENVRFSSKLDLFNSYERYTDVNWEGSVNMKINRFLTTSFLFHLIYDHDIPIPIYQTINGQQVQTGTGPRTQFKQLLGVGFSVNF